MKLSETGAVPNEPTAEVVRELQLPLKNMEYTVQSYLLENASRLDPETRLLLAGLRDSLAMMAWHTSQSYRPEQEKKHRAA